MAIQHALQSDEPMTCRVIKRYSNRKLYDTKGSRYVTLLQIADMVRAGEEVQIIDNSTKEDKTEVTMALIISEQLKEGMMRLFASHPPLEDRIRALQGG